MHTYIHIHVCAWLSFTGLVKARLAACGAEPRTLSLQRLPPAGHIRSGMPSRNLSKVSWSIQFACQNVEISSFAEDCIGTASVCGCFCRAQCCGEQGCHNSIQQLLLLGFCAAVVHLLICVRDWLQLQLMVVVTGHSTISAIQCEPRQPGVHSM